MRDAQALERMERVDTVVVDKTGTLTRGRPALVALEGIGWTDEELLRWAASLERSSEHPLAKAIVDAAADRGIALGEASGIDVRPGRGVVGTVDGRRVALGSEALLRELGAEPGPVGDRVDRWRTEGATVVFAAVDGALAGLLALADPIQETAPAAIAMLRAEGVRVVMITGDAERTARVVAAKLGIDEVEARVLPHEKAARVEVLQSAGRVVAMAGDGINDAPALARADVGIAMGTGTDIAIGSASVTLVKGDLRGIARARTLSRDVMRNVRQNLFFAFAYNVAGVPIAAGVLYPLFGVLLSPMIASAAMSLSSVSVIANALRLCHPSA